MKNELIYELCERLDLGVGLGDSIISVCGITGGLLHKMYRVETAKGIYAIKALNPEIMKRENITEIYILSEKFAEAAYKNGIPAVCALEFPNIESVLHNINGQYFMLYNWVEGKTIKPCDVTDYHCASIAKLLARIHNIPSDETPSKPNEAEAGLFGMFNARQAICHRDLDCKNVLWKNGSPYIIDWESSGYANPLIDLVDTALYWSWLEEERFEDELFELFIRTYMQNGGVVEGDIFTALLHVFKGKFGWLEYNITRALKDSYPNDEKTLAENEIWTSIAAIKEYEKILPVCLNIIKTII